MIQSELGTLKALEWKKLTEEVTNVSVVESTVEKRLGGGGFLLKVGST
jgi:hypothetical protein